MKRQTAVVGRWPLAVGRWPLAFGRWPLAVGLSLGALCAFDMPVAHAGQWEVVPLPVPNLPHPWSDPYQVDANWRSEAVKRYPGNIEVRQTSASSESISSPIVALPDQTLPIASWGSSNGDGGLDWHFGAGMGSTGGAGSISYDGTLKMVLRYHQDPLKDANGNTLHDANGAEMPDPDDVPNDTSFIKVTLYVDTYADSSNDDYYWYGYGDNDYVYTHDAGKEHLEVTVIPGGDVANQHKVQPSEMDEDGWKFYHSEEEIYVPIKPQAGELEKTVDIVGLHIKASIDGNRQVVYPNGNGSTVEWLLGSGAINAGYSGELKNLSLRISSDIEPSWRKLDGPLPDNYKKWIIDANGQRVFGPDPSKARLVAKDYFGTNDVWAVVCSPIGDGMTVESAAEWKGSQWMGSTQFNANQSGFDSPTFTWTKPSGAMGGNTSASSLDLTLADQGIGNYVQGINLGGNVGGQGLTRKSTAKVTVKDANFSLSSSYNVNWHLPYEWDSAPYATGPGPNEIFAQPGYYVDGNGNTQTSVGTNKTFYFKEEAPVTEYKMVSKDGLSTAGLVLGTAATGAGLILVYASSSAAALAGPVGWLALALAAAGAGTTYVAGTMPEPTPDQKESTYAQYKADMIHQKMVNDARAIDPNAYPLDTPRSTNTAASIDAAVQEINRIGSAYGEGANTHWNEDNFFNSSGISCTARMGRYTEINSWRGDEYGHNGFVGKCLLDVTKPKSVFYVFTWTFSLPTTPPPPPGIGGIQ